MLFPAWQRASSSGMPPTPSTSLALSLLPHLPCGVMAGRRKGTRDSFLDASEF